MKYIKQLDSLRAIAVILVMINHWITYRFINNIPTGNMGVDIFFVLSGFLITKILFDSRQKAETSGSTKSRPLKNFFIRRALRIFPIYYVTLFVLLLFQKSTETNIQSAFGYFVTYTSNFYFFNMGDWDGMISHLWSLSVEEQFYLIWPWIILFTPAKYLRNIIIGFIIIGSAGNFFTSGIKLNYILTFTCFDAFGLGALLAWQLTYKPQGLKRFFINLSVFTVPALALFILGIIQQQWPYIPLRTLNATVALWFITYIIIYADTGKLRFGFIFNNRVLIYLGKISYGIYLFHNFIPDINRNIINVYVNPLLPDVLYKDYWNFLFLAENIILVIIISSLSYILIEKRFLNLKKYFEYSNGNTAQTGASAKGRLQFIFSKRK